MEIIYPLSMFCSPITHSQECLNNTDAKTKRCVRCFYFEREREREWEDERKYVDYKCFALVKFVEICLLEILGIANSYSRFPTQTR